MILFTCGGPTPIHKMSERNGAFWDAFTLKWFWNYLKLQPRKNKKFPTQTLWGREAIPKGVFCQFGFFEASILYNDQKTFQMPRCAQTFCVWELDPRCLIVIVYMCTYKYYYEIVAEAQVDWLVHGVRKKWHLSSREGDREATGCSKKVFTVHFL